MHSSDRTKTVNIIFKDCDKNIVFRDCQMHYILTTFETLAEIEKGCTERQLCMED